MCMIALRTASLAKRGANMPNEVIDTALVRHSDGYGVSWRSPATDTEPGALLYAKFGPKERAEFRTLLKELDGLVNIEYVAHFRFATQGPAVKELAHPYSYMDPDPNVGEVLVFHNGVINIQADKSESDTLVFVRDVLADLPSRWWTIPVLVSLVDMSIGWSRLVIMTKDETVNLQEQDGKWDNGIWYSSDHKPKVYTIGTPTTSTTYGSTLGRGWSKYDDEGDEAVEAYWKEVEDKRAGSTIRTVTGAVDKADPNKWYHGGHSLSALVEIDRTKDGDFMKGLICDECYTVGDLYIIDGSAYIDMGHQFDPAAVDDEDNEDQLDLLPVEAAPAVLLH
jgi:hypothetical protein